MRKCLPYLACALMVSQSYATEEWLGVPFSVNAGNDATLNGQHTFTPSSSGGANHVSITTRGQDIWNTADSGSFYFAPEIGDCEVVATVPPLIQAEDNANIGNYAKAGVMFRLSTWGNSPMAMLLRETSRDGVSRSRFICRPSTSANAADIRTTTTHFPTNEPVRLRLVRQGRTVAAYVSTNATFSVWEKFSEYTFANDVFADGILGGVALTPQNSATNGLATLEFGSIAVRPLVAATQASDRIQLSWGGEGFVTNGMTLSGYTLSRSESGTAAWNDVTTAIPAGSTSAEDTSAVAGVEYAYRLTAELTDAAMTPSTVVVGESHPVRIPVQTANANSGQKGFAMQYIQNDVPVGSLVYSTSVYNPWEAILDPNDPRYRIYPDFAEPNLDGRDNFTIEAQGVIRVPSTGLYTIRQWADDLASVSVNGQVVVRQTGYISQAIYSSPFYLEAGKNYPITYTFRENSGDEALQLRLHRVGSGDNYISYAGPTTEAVPHPWTAVELGASPIFGNTIYDLASKSFSVHGSGLGWTNAYDEAQTCTLPLAAGDFDFVARLVLNGSDSASRGILIRTNPYAEAPEQVVLSIAGDSAFVHVRSAPGAGATVHASAPLPSGGSSAFYLRLSRRDGTLQCSIADGLNADLPTSWTPVGGPVTLPAALSGAVVGGLGVASGNRTSLASASFDNVSALDDLSLSVSLQTNPSGDSSVTLLETSAASRRADTAASMGSPAYLWSDAVSRVVTSFNLNAFEGIPTNAPGPLLAEDVSAGTSVPYTFVSEDPHAIAFFTVQGQTTIFGSDGPGSALDPQISGLSRETVASNGTGLFVAYYKTVWEGPETDPNAKEVRGLDPWVYAQDGNWRTASGTDIGSKDFHAIFSGYLTAPHSGYYRFHQTANGSIIATLDGMNIFYNPAINSPAASFSTDWIYLEGGKRLPFFVAYRNSNTSTGVFSLKWEHNGGTETGVVEIPLNVLSSDLTATAPARVVAGSAETFGGWTDLQWGANRAGQSTIHGTLASDILKPETMNVVLLSCNAYQDFERTYDRGHFLHRSVPADQDFLFEATVSKPTGWSSWLRQGLMVRSSTASNSPAIAVFRTKNGRIRSQVRAQADTKLLTTTELTGAEGRDVRIRIERTGSAVRTYSDDVQIGSYNTKTWTGPIQVGFVGGSYDDRYHSIVFFSDAVFKGLPKPCTVLVVR